MSRTSGEAIWMVTRRAILRSLLVAFLLVPVACSASGDEDDAPSMQLLVTSGRFSTTIAPDSETEIPFAEIIYVEAEFEDEIYGLGGQTAVKITTEPPRYRVVPQRPPNPQTYRVALAGGSPGEVAVSVYENSQSEPVEFTLIIEDAESGE